MALLARKSPSFLHFAVSLLLRLVQNDAFAVYPVRPTTISRTLSRLATQQATISAILHEGLERMEYIMDPDFEPLSNLYSQCCKSIEIKESSIPDAGLGLFAKKNIKANTIVSFYPAHALGVDSDEDSYGDVGAGSGTFVSNDENDEEYFSKHPSFQSSYLHCTDQPLFQRTSLLQQAGAEGTPLFLDVNPSRPIVNGAWVSQMINDGATVVDASTEAGVLRYYDESGKRKNCIHIPFGPSPIMATISTKKIKKGEEILTSYGATYWLGVLHGNNDAVGVTPKIQARIQETARDLQKSMTSVSIVYANQLEALQIEYDKLSNHAC